jgi:hypothetical protein
MMAMTIYAVSATFTFGSMNFAGGCPTGRINWSEGMEWVES